MNPCHLSFDRFYQNLCKATRENRGPPMEMVRVITVKTNVARVSVIRPILKAYTYTRGRSPSAKCKSEDIALKGRAPRRRESARA